jgi:enamine deaminase RidA (YjgF/YER057c/UK114 family)
MAIEIFNPDSISTPAGTYSHVAEVAPGVKLVAIAGQVALDREGKVVGAGDIEAQCAQVYANLGAALEAAGGDWSNVLQFMSFLTRKEDIPKFAAFRRREFPKFYPNGSYPPNTLLVVSALATDALLLEVQAIAAI